MRTGRGVAVVVTFTLLFAFVADGWAADAPAAPKSTAYKAWPFNSAEAVRRQTETATALGVPVRKEVDLGDGVKLTLVLIPAGEFVMGSPAEEKGRYNDETPHRIAITKPFYISTTEVTRGQFAAFVIAAEYKTTAEQQGWAVAVRNERVERVPGASWRKPGFKQTDRHPVVSASWYDADALCRWLARKTTETVRLPTEAEWEYVCRAGNAGAYQWGDKPGAGQGWSNAADLTARKIFPDWTTFDWADKYVFTAPVGSFKPNAWGVYDMHGNVWEWCADWYNAKYYATGPKESPKGPAVGAFRALRGGSWFNSPRDCRSAYRSGGTPSLVDVNGGFRIVFVLRGK